MPLVTSIKEERTLIMKARKVGQNFSVALDCCQHHSKMTATFEKEFIRKHHYKEHPLSVSTKKFTTYFVLNMNVGLANAITDGIINSYLNMSTFLENVEI